MCDEETTSPSTSRSGTTRVSKRGSSRSICASPWALWPKRKFSPTLTCVAATRSTSTCSTKSLRVLGGERAVERDHHQLLDTQRGDQLRLAVERRQQLGLRARRDHRLRVRIERHDGLRPRDHLPVTEVHTIERPDRDLARPRLHVGEVRELHARKPTAVTRGAVCAAGSRAARRVERRCSRCRSWRKRQPLMARHAHLAPPSRKLAHGRARGTARPPSRADHRGARAGSRSRPAQPDERDHRRLTRAASSRSTRWIAAMLGRSAPAAAESSAARSRIAHLS